MTFCPSGRQTEISFEDQTAVLVEVGGGIRSYHVGTRPVLDPYPENAICDGAHGTPLIPWPNRLRDGRYNFDGIDYQLPLSEPTKGNAIHGLLRWRPWELRSSTSHQATLTAKLFPMSGYPFLLEMEITYSLSQSGLLVETLARNAGSTPCPYGAGQHPYLSPGSGHIDDCRLSLGAKSYITTDAARQLPTGSAVTSQSDYDFTDAKTLGTQRLDLAYTDLIRDPNGLAWARLQGADRRWVELWVDESYPVLEAFTGDTLTEDRRRRGLGIEPMTCPPNAFQSGEHLVRLEPGQTHRSTWGVRLA